jgi:ankyrin repeat protein
VQALLAKGAEANAKARDGQTALMQASWKGHLNVAQALIAKGVDVNAKANNGDTALTLAKDADVRTLLVQAGAKP